MRIVNGGDFRFTHTQQQPAAPVNGGGFQFGGTVPPPVYDPPRPGNQWGHQYPPQPPPQQAPPQQPTFTYGYQAPPQQPHVQHHSVLEGAAIGAAAGYAYQESRRWHAYKDHVGVGNTSLQGFHIWTSKLRQIVRRQPRVNVTRGLLMLGASVTLYLLANIPGLSSLGILFFGVLCVASLVFGIRQFRHQQPPQADLDALYTWHKTFAENHGVPQTQEPGDTRGRVQGMGPG